MFNLKGWLMSALVSGFVTGQLTWERVAFMAVDYMSKGLLHPADMEDIANATNPSKTIIEE